MKIDLVILFLLLMLLMVIFEIELFYVMFLFISIQKDCSLGEYSLNYYSECIGCPQGSFQNQLGQSAVS